MPMQSHLKISILLLLFLSVFALNAQEKNKKTIDSLEQRVKACSSDTCRINTLNKLAKEYLSSNKVEKTVVFANKALEQSTKINYQRGIGEAINYLGKIEKRKTNYEKALQHYDKSLKIFEELKDTLWISRNLNNIGEIYVNWGQYENAIIIYERALKVKQINIKDKKGMAITLNSIGLVYLRLSRNEEAVKYFQNALKIFEEIGFTEGIASTYNNLGSIYQNTAVGNDTIKLYKALDYFNKALILQKKQPHKEREVADLFNNIGNIYAQQADLYRSNILKSKDKNATINIKRKFRTIKEKSIEYYSESLKSRELIKDKAGIASSYSNIGLAYSNIGEIFADNNALSKAQNYLQQALVIQKEQNNLVEISITYFNIAQNYFYMKQYDKAIPFLEQSQTIARDIKVKKTMLTNYLLFALIYDSLGNYKKALAFERQFSDVKDSITNEASVKAIQEMQTKYQTEKKEQQIKLLDSEKQLQETQIKQQRIIIFAFVGGFIIILIFSIIIYKQYREKKKANVLLAYQNAEIMQQKEEISAQRDEIEKRKEVAEKQRDEITEQKHEIDDSIRYAKRIQHAVLSQTEQVAPFVKEMFTMFKPKDVVSGDFYFVKYIERSDILIAAAADCTGHGVPGAFMSMLGVTFLNEICSKPEIQHANEVLNILREYVIKSLHQTGKFGEQKDGMDISLIALSIKNKTVEFSGANNPLYLIRNNELIEFKGDKMPIGIHDRADLPFTNKTIPIEEGDCIYLFSDGFADQFGGEKGRKYMYKKFKDFFLSIHQKPMAEQQELLAQESVNWRGSLEQIDDQIIMGIRI